MSRDPATLVEVFRREEEMAKEDYTVNCTPLQTIQHYAKVIDAEVQQIADNEFELDNSVWLAEAEGRWHIGRIVNFPGSFEEPPSTDWDPADGEPLADVGDAAQAAVLLAVERRLEDAALAGFDGLDEAPEDAP